MHLRLMATAALLSSNVCNAATIVQYFGANAGPGYYSPALIDRYSGAGKLDSVTIKYQTGVFIYGVLTPNDPIGSSYQLNISGNVGISFLNKLENYDFIDIRIFSSDDLYSTPTYAVDSSYLASVSDLTLFTGSGQFELQANGSEAVTSPSGTYTVLSEQPSTFASGTVTYTFGVVPEPSSWTMIIAGTALIGGALRRKRRVSTVPGSSMRLRV